MNVKIYLKDIEDKLDINYDNKIIINGDLENIVKFKGKNK